MALKTLSTTNIVNGNIVQAADISQSIDAFTGTEGYAITLSGSFTFTGATTGSGYFSNAVNSITSLNEDSLEQTVVYFKPAKSLGTVKAISNNLTTNFTSSVTPDVTLYIKSNTDLSVSILKDYKDIIGKILHRHLELREFSLTNIKAEIISTLGENIRGVKIEKITDDN